MNKSLLSISLFAVFVALLALPGWSPALGWQQQLPPGQPQELPPGHPPIHPDLPPGHPPIDPGMPPGHPPINPGMPPGHPPIDGPKHVPADPVDVTTAEAIVQTYYEVVSGPAGAERDWDRFRSLFIPEARLIAAQGTGSPMPCMVMGVEQFVQMNSVYFQQGGYFEQEIHQRIERFGNAAHAFSTYESRRSLDDAKPYSRGVNSMQLVYDGSRWWITTVLWDYERPDNPIPAKFLPDQAAMAE